jgi:hypothetical protein
MDTPVVFFVFRRPETTVQVFSEIRKARPKQLFLIADGPRAGVLGEVELCARTRELLSNIDWPCEVTRIFAKTNLGLRNRILSGLDDVFSTVDRAIILEDDCLPTESFFRFCEDLLTKYENSPELALLAGFNHAPLNSNHIHDYYFSKSASIWGWATWASEWRKFRSSPQLEAWSESELDELSKTFKSGLQRREFMRLARSAKSLNTWDVSVAVWLRQNGLLTAVPFTNLVSNIGFGEQATHTKFEAFDVQVPSGDFSGPLRHPEDIRYDPKHEVRAWRKKRLRWITYPTTHPVEFVKRLMRFFRMKSQS